ncbi:SWIM zinc finger domain protein [Gleimia coleocanis DSM 15436]|uniref:SWIM zinc finger domain protein n=1 Tax=Gleimia coleocanis DSM 15436 TaxID=525245 RepID=C0W1X7_9ACTO|nr:hypothetical protein [Gleimia coleocanis]EEH63493.1 SWIM zinc finger domain protein [Gleimia coleocanis DSM 15436]
MRAFSETTSLTGNSLHLALAPGKGIGGAAENLTFFTGFTNEPQVVARSLVALSEITSTRYYKYTPQSQRDPILSAHGDRLRAECFSACNSVYACFELFDSALDGGQIGFGTTNVDINSETRRLLSEISAHETLRLNVSAEGLTAVTKTQKASERPVEMPSRWLNALGNISQILPEFKLAFQVSASAAKAFLATLPPASAVNGNVWLTLSGNSINVSKRPLPDSVLIPGVHRLSALKRLLPYAQGMSIFQSATDGLGALLSLDLPGGRFTLLLTEEAWRGFSGEGSMLVSLAADNVVADADLVSAVLAFEAVIDLNLLAEKTGLSAVRVESALALLAGSGRVGWDPHARAYFHRELPAEHENVLQSNPRLGAARKLYEGGRVRAAGPDWIVKSGSTEYFIRLGNDLEALEVGAVCNCFWHVSHGGRRGPCKHILAAILKRTENK